MCVLDRQSLGRNVQDGLKREEINHRKTQNRAVMETEIGGGTEIPKKPQKTRNSSGISYVPHAFSKAGTGIKLRAVTDTQREILSLEALPCNSFEAPNITEMETLRYREVPGHRYGASG